VFKVYTVNSNNKLPNVPWYFRLSPHNLVGQRFSSKHIHIADIDNTVRLRVNLTIRIRVKGLFREVEISFRMTTLLPYVVSFDRHFYGRSNGASFVSFRDLHSEKIGK